MCMFFQFQEKQGVPFRSQVKKKLVVGKNISIETKLICAIQYMYAHTYKYKQTHTPTHTYTHTHTHT